MRASHAGLPILVIESDGHDSQHYSEISVKTPQNPRNEFKAALTESILEMLNLGRFWCNTGSSDSRNVYCGPVSAPSLLTKPQSGRLTEIKCTSGHNTTSNMIVGIMNTQLRDPLLSNVGSCVFNEPTIPNLLFEHFPLANPFDFWFGIPESSIKRPNSI